MQAEQLLIVLLLGGLLGMTGQGIRVIAGIKKLHDETTHTRQNFRDNFDIQTLLVSLFIGFIAGVLAIVALWGKIDPNNLQSENVIALLGAGYAGADFIEAFMSRSKLPSTAPAPSTDSTTQ